MRKLFLPVLFALRLCAQSPVDLEAVVTTDLGSFRFEFAPDKAPKHVDEFIKRAREGYYDGSSFFRVVPGGLIQGGDPLLKDPKTPRKLWGTGGLNVLKDEFSTLKHERGVVSTVRVPGRSNSDSTQFFVCLYQQPQLDGKFSSFGRVTEGLDIAEKISRVPTDAKTMTEKPVRIISVTIEKKKVEPFLNATVDEMRRTVEMKTTLGTIRIQMEPDWAPEHVRNFLKLVSSGWYDGVGFHRLIKDFMAQGGLGDQRAGGQPHPADRWVRTMKGEFRDDIKHDRGIVSMARTDNPNSASTSFFLMLGASPHLDGQYSAFGKVVEGMEVLEAFNNEPVDGETPKRRLEIISARIEAK